MRASWKSHPTVVVGVFLVVGLLTYMSLLRFDPRPAWITRTSWDAGIPVVPAFVWIYLSPYLLAPLVARAISAASLPSLMRRAYAFLVVFYVPFLFFPTQVDRPAPPGATGLSASALTLIYAIDTPPRNAAPSGHVGMAFAVGWLMWQSRRVPRMVIAMWVGAVCMSILLTGQHHVVDLVTGVAASATVFLGADVWERWARARGRAVD